MFILKFVDVVESYSILSSPFMYTILQKIPPDSSENDEKKKNFKTIFWHGFNRTSIFLMEI